MEAGQGGGPPAVDSARSSLGSPALPLAAFLIAALTLLAPACESGPSYRQARAGTAIALETRHTATELARRLSERPDPGCGAWTAAAPLVAEVTWSVEGYRAGAPVLELNEVRRLEMDAHGGLRLLREVDFRTPTERTGQRDREWRLVGGHVYTRELNLPFEARQADASEADRLRDAVPEVFETLVRAAGGAWHGEAADRGWDLDTTPRRDPPQLVRCGREGTPDPWLDDLLDGARLLSGRARVRQDASGRTVERSGGWTFELLDTDVPLTLEAAVSERLEWGADVAIVEAPADVFDTTRPRPYAELEAFLRALDALEASDNGAGEGTSRGTGEGTGLDPSVGESGVE